MTDETLRRAIQDLAAIHAEGRLSDLQLAFAAACREAGGLPSAAERNRQSKVNEAATAVTARELANVAAHFLGLPVAKCRQVALDVLVHDPWAVIALDIIRDYSPSTPQLAAEQPPTQQLRRKW